jgi:hypothetical protein
MIMVLRKLLLLQLLCCSMAGFSQLSLQPGTTFFVLPQTSLQLNQELDIQNGATFRNHGVLLFKGTFLNAGVYEDLSTSRLIANGALLQTIAGNSLALPYLKLMNPEGVELRTTVQITDSLVLQDGILFSSANYPVYFTPTAVNPVEKPGSYINGRAVMEPRNIGVDSVPVFLGYSTSDGSDIGLLSITRNTGADAIHFVADRKVSIAADWNISTSNTPGTPDRKIYFSWISSTDNGRNMKAIDLYKGPAPFTRITEDSTDVSGSDPRIFRVAAGHEMNGFYTLSSHLPNVSFLRFTGVLQQNGVQLEWMTGTEFDNRGFDIERSVDGTNFSKISFVAGKNAPLKNDYSFLDTEVAQLKSRAAWYRLKQMDIYGNFQYSNTILVSMNGSGLYFFNVFPNPFRDVVMIDLDKEDEEPVAVRLVGINGARVFEKEYAVGKKGRITITGLSKLASGPYVLQVSNEHFRENIKLIKTKN